MGDSFWHLEQEGEKSRFSEASRLLYWGVVYFIIVYSAVLHFTAVHCTALYCTALYSIRIRTRRGIDTVKGLYVTVYPEMSPNIDSISF